MDSESPIKGNCNANPGKSTREAAATGWPLLWVWGGVGFLMDNLERGQNCRAAQNGRADREWSRLGDRRALHWEYLELHVPQCLLDPWTGFTVG